MREKIARRLVKYVSEAMNQAYEADQITGDKTSAARWNQKFRFRQKYVLPIALKFDRWNGAEQMAQEGWWG